ncbi:aromatic ring-hydroxylating dioxygenase subunit alpha [Sphingobium sp. CFD-1]|uniref:aromatic ring-hydroxylating oxygenase subunit alpha n=1 Tax=Sphingobium sp. CFD-1 TaxID=2878545 RepID=UPI00214C02E6|nr:SRPBCC family protein [Sphingobium sp. CFD-1]
MMELDVEKALAEFDVGLGRMHPDEDIIRTGKVASDTYLSKNRFDQEMEVFRRVWLNVGLESDVPKPGSWIVRDVEAGKASILIARGQDGIIRAFHNVCSHRALKLVWGEQGCDSQFVCPYHAWSYASDGRLRGVPDRAASFPDLDFATSGLTPIAIEVWKGLIFINLDPEPAQTLRDFLGGVMDLLEDTPLDRFRYTARLSGVVQSNWKAGFDAASEGYHVRALHADSAKDMVCSQKNPHVHFVSLDVYGPHRRTSNTRNPDFVVPESKPIQKLIFEAVPQVTVADAAERGAFDVAGLNPTQDEDWSNEQISIFPNCILSLAMHGFWTMHYWPISPDSFRWEAHYHFAKSPQTWTERFGMEASVAFNRDISSEDIACTEKQHTAMESGAKPFIQFGIYEMICRHQAAVLESIVNGSHATPMVLAAE